MGCLSFRCGSKSGEGPKREEGSGDPGKEGYRKEVRVWSPGVMATGKCRLLCSGLRVDRDEELEERSAESH